MRRYAQSKDTPYWVSYLKRRIDLNKNAILAITGPTGSGKSTASISIAEQVDPKFTTDQIVTSGKELMELINSDKLHRGSAIVFEEAGVEMSNKNWQSKMNKMLNYLMQTFRHRNFIMIINSPYLDFIDSSTRKLFHAEMATQGIDFKNKLTILKPQLIQYNGRMKKFYYKYLKVLTPKGVAPIKVWRVPQPSDKVMEEYEIKKKAYTDQLYLDITRDFIEDDAKKKAKTEMTDNQMNVLNSLEQCLHPNDIAKETNTTPRNIYAIMLVLKKKGYSLKPK